MPDQKQWVFTRLVMDTDDTRQLIAYAIYKAGDAANLLI